jgi:hypothetical protein
MILKPLGGNVVTALLFGTRWYSASIIVNELHRVVNSALQQVAQALAIEPWRSSLGDQSLAIGIDRFVGTMVTSGVLIQLIIKARKDAVERGDGSWSRMIAQSGLKR